MSPLAALLLGMLLGAGIMLNVMPPMDRRFGAFGRKSRKS